MAHYLTAATVGEIFALRTGGAGLREIARELGVSKNTVARYVGANRLTSICPCGKPAGHKGWCQDRIAKSARRQAYLAGEPVPPAVPPRSRIKRVVLEKRVWLGLEPFCGKRLPEDEWFAAIGEINRLTQRLRNDVREDVRQEMFVSCLEGRCPRAELERAIPTFWGFVTRGFVWRNENAAYDVANIFYAGEMEEAA